MTKTFSLKLTQIGETLTLDLTGDNITKVLQPFADSSGESAEVPVEDISKDKVYETTIGILKERVSELENDLNLVESSLTDLTDKHNKSVEISDKYFELIQKACDMQDSAAACRMIIKHCHDAMMDIMR